MYQSLVKPLFDFLFSLILLALLFPILILLLLINSIHFRGNPVFVQSRPGLNGRVFKLFKLKTMREANSFITDDKEEANRVTGFGRLLRKTSLDELPQLLNVLKGDMSIVGPRPLRVEYLSLYNEAQRRRHEVKPGITGLVQVSGASGLSWEKRFELDTKYVNEIGFWTDIKILFLTGFQFFSARRSDALEFERFKGNQQ
ncbi:MAG: sugar transferase [Cryomorphaceae bacterium]|nr:sugar transferase [Cryomorphaceae bacterium]